MRSNKLAPVLGVVLLIAAGVGAGVYFFTEKNEGPAERAGESIDKAVDSVKDSVN